MPMLAFCEQSAVLAYVLRRRARCRTPLRQTPTMTASPQQKTFPLAHWLILLPAVQLVSDSAACLQRSAL
jgi:hypothetical protein